MLIDNIYTDADYREAAKKLISTIGLDADVDDDGPVSRSAGGAYVQVWVYIYDEAAAKED